MESSEFMFRQPDYLCANRGQSVDGRDGIEVRGGACGMTGMTGWLFDYDIDDEHYYMDYSTNATGNAEPIIVGMADWLIMMHL